jgi:ribonuclease VapC
MATMVCPNDRRRHVGADGIVPGEPEAKPCIAALETETEILISAATVAEALIVADRRNVTEEMAGLIDGLGFEIVTVTAASARRIAETCAQWGKGIHPAGLNFGDCFAYELAKERGCGLLFVGDDFAKTDLNPL